MTRHEASQPDVTVARLYGVAMRHLERYATTQEGMRLILTRYCKRWQLRNGQDMLSDERNAPQRALTIVEQTLELLCRQGLLNDATFGASRARRSIRSGHSRAFALMQLKRKGLCDRVAHESFDEALNDLALSATEAERASALTFARKRRLGPFSVEPFVSHDPKLVQKTLSRFARAGFSRSISEEILALTPEEATAQEKLSGKI